MEKFARFAVPAGLTLLVAGGIAYNIRPDLKTWMGSVLLLGAILILVSVYRSFGGIMAWLNRRSTITGLNVVVMTMLVLGIIGLVEVISAKHNTRFDLTQGKRYSLADQTKKVIRGLATDVQVTAFFRADQAERQPAEDLLRQYADLSQRFRFEVVDPDRNPGRAKRYGIATYGTTVLETKDKEEKISEVDEEHLTNGLVKLLREGKRTIYFLKGHGENELEDGSRNGYRQAKEAIEKANYQVKELLLLREREVPQDASMLVISGPKRDLAESELQALQAFIERGGKLLIQLDPFAASSLKVFVSRYGITIGDDVIVDQNARVMGGDYLMPVVSTYYPHAITQNFTLASLFPFARSVDVAKPSPQGVTVQKLGETGPGSWAETDKGELNRGQLGFEKGQDREGPVPVGAIATVQVKPATAQKSEAEKAATAQRTNEEQTDKQPEMARLVVYGNSAFASNNFLNFSGNRDLFLNSISWLAEEEGMISIRPREAKNTPIILSAAQGRMAFWFLVVVVPGLFLVSGTSVVLGRRRSR
ncbi:Gldg family protein [Candidatus Methylomirabilis sp.]|uniref:GldG family protein n=1 Tax=Candidatus Methylomirabilis sp. TaxID=2032687 RepID=UPI002A607E7A|nr:Gldg family protein [Candidatus Methylomirabilis sp.]